MSSADELFIGQVAEALRSHLASRPEAAAPLQPNERDAVAAQERARLNMDFLLPLTPAARAALMERQRQVSVEGWTHEHDDTVLADGSLAKAAACYALAACGARNLATQHWPWTEPPKFGPAARMLEKATALLLAESERLARRAAIVEAQRRGS